MLHQFWRVLPYADKTNVALFFPHRQWFAYGWVEPNIAQGPVINVQLFPWVKSRLLIFVLILLNNVDLVSLCWCSSSTCPSFTMKPCMISGSSSPISSRHTTLESIHPVSYWKPHILWSLTSVVNLSCRTFEAHCYLDIINMIISHNCTCYTA